ncbi:elongation factor 1-gamma-like [Ylistrum balloti]|uniref:elongation factor 1-gamma-like n=1 Tax=Ylistrum balloti TaxID=509963 RepID=UPI00290584C3|nr:elongation factor 1-gamma-like [Ylistrum balloti]
MATGTLYTYPENFRAYKALIAAQYSGAKVTVSSGFKLGESNTTKEFLQKFPLGKVPAFESSNGDCVFESNAIAHYVGNAQLQGSNTHDQAVIQQWINFGDNEIYPASCTWVFPTLGITPFNKQEGDKAKEQMKKALTVLNNYLRTRTYLVGERISQADISLACNLMLAYQNVMDPSFRGSFGNVNRWFNTLINQPQFKSVIGSFSLCSKMKEADGKKYAELHGGGKKEGKSKKEQKKEQPKKQQPKKETEVEPEDDIPQLPKEKKDPWAECPPTKFNFDEFKREYSNKDIVKEALPYFWKHFEPENMSIWHCDYNYKDDLSQVFMTSNLMRGFFQRIDKMRKNSFASMCILGEEKGHNISGVWFWRGQNLAFELNEDWSVDYESYTWKKLDPSDEKDRKLVEDYFSTPDIVNGEKFIDGNVFK